jgi:hypothetical protein
MYPYLCASLVLLVFFLIAFFTQSKQRRPMLLSALFSAPYAFLSIFFVPAYWNPVRVLHLSIGIEDILFSFSNGGIVWLLATWPLRDRLILDIQIKQVFKRYLIFTASGITFWLILILSGCDPMHGAFLGIVVIIVLLLWLRIELWPLILVGMLSFGLLYFIFCSITFAMNPNFLMQWNVQSLSGNSLLGVPIEEIVWGMSFGALWPLLMGYSFNTRLSVPPS